ncbi:hypothetical protein B0H14DRAFT_2623844 [Mycena olivaceomarginata]|nr:hypothetical protein B0H14DRAFT_2623844 [Mycena olivaceomarginata]
MSPVAVCLSSLKDCQYLDGVKQARANDGVRRAFIDEIKALDGVLAKMAKDTRAAVDESFDVDGRAKKALVGGVANPKDLQLQSDTIVDLRERIKDLKGGAGCLGALKGTIYSSRNGATLSDMKDTLASAIRIFQIQGQISIENILIGVIQAVKDEEAKGPGFYPSSCGRVSLRARAKGGIPRWNPAGVVRRDHLWSAGDFPWDTRQRFYFISGGLVWGSLRLPTSSVNVSTHPEVSLP